MDPTPEDTGTTDEDDDKWFDELMQKPTTLPNDLIITMTNFADEQDAQKCGGVLRGYLQLFGRLMDLSRLDRVYATFDYPGTLASLDRGFAAVNVLTPTNDHIAEGVAMAPSVKREDGWKSVIVINASYARALSFEIDGSSDVTQEQLAALRAETIHILAHECGHVHDHTLQTANLPEDTHSKKWSHIDQRLKEPGMGCWSEYIAEYLGADFGTKDTLGNYENSFCDRLKAAWPAITKAIRQYRMHGNVDQVISEVGTQIRHVIIYAAYLLGYLSRKKLSLDPNALRAKEAIEANPELGVFIERLQEELDNLHEQYPRFNSLDVFNPLSELIHDMYKRAGLTFTPNDEGLLRVDIPHRPDTLPSLQEQIEFRLASRRDTQNPE